MSSTIRPSHTPPYVAGLTGSRAAWLRQAQGVGHSTGGPGAGPIRRANLYARLRHPSRSRRLWMADSVLTHFSDLPHPRGSAITSRSRGVSGPIHARHDPPIRPRSEPYLPQCRQPGEHSGDAESLLRLPWSSDPLAGARGSDPAPDATARTEQARSTLRRPNLRTGESRRGSWPVPRVPFGGGPCCTVAAAAARR
jgi:hypothetical protein